MTHHTKPYNLHVKRSGGGKPVVLIHGVAGSTAIWDPLMPLLTTRYDVWRLDLLGYGYSPKPNIDYTLSTHLEAIHHTLTEQNIPKPYNLVGLSMGSLLVLEYANRYPGEVATVCMIGTPYYQTEDEARESLRQSFWTNLVVHHPLQARLLIPIAWPIGRRSGVLRRLLGPDRYSDKVTYESTLTSVRAFTSTIKEVMIKHRLSRSDFKRSRIPMLFIHGDSDQWTNATAISELASENAASRVHVIDNAHHTAVVLSPDETAQVYTAFLRRNRQ